MMKRFMAMFLTKVYLITALGFALNLHFCGDALASVKITGAPKPCKESVVVAKKCCNDKQLDVKVKDAHQAETPSIISKLLSFEMPKIAFGDFVLSAQKALLEKLSDEDPPAPPPPSGKTSQYIKNGILRI
jgi:hypothetical protein